MHIAAPQLVSEFLPDYEADLQSLVSEHFQPMYTLVNLFCEDHEAALRQTEEVFRTTAGSEELSRRALYAHAAARIDTGRTATPLLSLLTREQALCWLLKELGGLSYAEIADALGLERRTVRHRIAESRQALLPLF